MSRIKILGISAIVFVAIVFLVNGLIDKPYKEKNSLALVDEEEISLDIEDIEDLIVREENVEIYSSSIHEPTPKELEPLSDDSELPADVDRMTQLFEPYPPLFPIARTISYNSRVNWLRGRCAYLGDYASHYATSKHFISRSLHGVGNYLSDIVSNGDRFNVFREDKEIEFHLVLDLSRLKLWVYVFDKKEDERFLLKTYRVCAGSLKSQTRSG